ncbi:MAG: hypothetical protein DCC75_01670, partial [Proteobacteria bacterium]
MSRQAEEKAGALRVRGLSLLDRSLKHIDQFTYRASLRIGDLLARNWVPRPHSANQTLLWDGPLYRGINGIHINSSELMSIASAHQASLRELKTIGPSPLSLSYGQREFFREVWKLFELRQVFFAPNFAETKRWTSIGEPFESYRPEATSYGPFRLLRADRTIRTVLCFENRGREDFLLTPDRKNIMCELIGGDTCPFRDWEIDLSQRPDIHKQLGIKWTSISRDEYAQRQCFWSGLVKSISE